MSLVDIIILAVALGIDCLVVSFAQGLIFKSERIKNSLRLAFTMGLFQGVMPFISYIGINFIEQYIEPYSSIIAFTIFLILGAKFIAGAFFSKKDELKCLDLKCLIALGVATSIDALASGISLKLTDSPMIISILIICFASFIMSISGFWVGNFFKKLPTALLEIFGGCILICLAIKSMTIF